MDDSYRIVPALPEHLPRLAAIERAAGALFPARDLPGELRSDTTPLAALR